MKLTEIIESSMGGLLVGLIKSVNEPLSLIRRRSKQNLADVNKFHETTKDPQDTPYSVGYYAGRILGYGLYAGIGIMAYRLTWME